MEREHPGPTWDVMGQEQPVAILRRAIEDEARLSHAYLFVGPEHVGKATAARRFAQALNCESGAAPTLEGLGDDEGSGERPCGGCRACRLIAEDKHPDVEWVAPGGVCEESEHKDHEGSRDIRICQVRRLERVVSRTAFEARYRVVIIDPADVMTTEAANAFLKTLEEPPPQVVLVLVTAREEALSETVRSRCRRIAFSGVPREQIEAALRERWRAEPAQAERLVRLAGGRLGWAVAALEDERLLIDRERAVEQMESLLRGGYNERFATAAELGARFPRSPDAVRSTLDLWRDWWRDVLLVAAERSELVSDPERLDTLRRYAAQYGVKGALQALTAVTEARQHLEERANPTLALEAMLLELPAVARKGA